MKKVFFLSICLIGTLFIIGNVSAHPGNTDSQGCHTCRTNCSSWGLSYGEYHCYKSKGISQPVSPITSTWGNNGTGYTTPAPSYSIPSYSSTPSCPLYSSYNYLTGGCKCNSGYFVEENYLGKESCVSGSTYCSNKYGLFASYDSLSQNCDCMSGYILEKDILGKYSCTSLDSFCRNEYGYNSKYNRLKDVCECNSGYVLENGKCTYKSSYSPLSSDYSFSNNLLNNEKCGINSYSTNDGKCSCYSGYKWVDKYDDKNLDCKKSDTCPANSYLSSDNKCSCNVGYEANNSKDGCVQIICGQNASLVASACVCNISYIDKDGVCILKEALIEVNNNQLFIESEKKLISSIDKKLSEKLKGRILLQVENNGEAWYVNPQDNKKYYMADGQEAYQIMRNLGVGITNKDLEKIKTDKKFAKQKSGTIFLQVESKGEAYYIDIEGNSHYLKDGGFAYNAMRSLGLGITNSDLRKIDVHEIR